MKLGVVRLKFEYYQNELGDQANLCCLTYGHTTRGVKTKKIIFGDVTWNFSHVEYWSNIANKAPEARFHILEPDVGGSS